MTNPETIETQPQPTPSRVAGVGSTAIHGLVTGAGGEAVVLGMSTHAVWLGIEDRVVVVSTSDATRLPNGIQIAAEASDDLFGPVTHGEVVDIGHGRVMFEELAVSVARWWDPRPVLSAVSVDQLAESIADLPNEVPDVDSGPLHNALIARSAGGVLHASRSLLGKGPGLTPEGDDFLAGTLAATRLLAESLSMERTIAMVAGVSVPLARLAAARTTTFSAALIEAALRGQVAEPAGALLRALTGRGDIRASHMGLIRVGHSSGPALAAGIVLGAQSLVESATHAHR